MKRIICYLFGHRVTHGLFENEVAISNKGCKRCRAPLFGASFHWKEVRSVPPPGSSKAEWETWCNNKEAKIRKEFAK